jgi:hypothetical protein
MICQILPSRPLFLLNSKNLMMILKTHFIFVLVVVSCGSICFSDGLYEKVFETRALFLVAVSHFIFSGGLSLVAGGLSLDAGGHSLV